MPVVLPVLTSSTNFIFEVFSFSIAPGKGNHISCKPEVIGDSSLKAVFPPGSCRPMNTNSRGRPRMPNSFGYGFQSCQTTESLAGILPKAPPRSLAAYLMPSKLHSSPMSPFGASLHALHRPPCFGSVVPATASNTGDGSSKIAVGWPLRIA